MHRIGRTGRAGRSGAASTIVTPADGKAISAIETLIGQPIAWMESIGGAEAAEPREATAPAETSGGRERGRGDRNRRGRGTRHERSERPRHGSGDSRAPVSADKAPRTPEPRREPRPARRPEPEVEGDASHLPAFLLRPVVVKA